MSLFISCDWGTSHLRLRLVDSDKKQISKEFVSEDGIAETYRRWMAAGKSESERIHFYKNVLADVMAGFSKTLIKSLPIVLSGMASSSIGMKEMPYCEFPFIWDPEQFGIEKIPPDEEFSHPIYLVTGFKTNGDIMRGEETILLGCKLPDEGEEIMIFPGTHSKQVHVKNKTGIDFTTYMTGELFNLLSEKSVLRTAVADGPDPRSFAEGFRAGVEGNLLHLLFSVRVRQILQKTDPVKNYQYLSGMLIGAELKVLTNRDCPVVLVSSEPLKTAYLQGLELLDLKGGIRCQDADEMFVRGQCVIAAQLFG